MAKQLVLDANILIRAVLGTRVSAIIGEYAADAILHTVEEAFEDAETYLPEILQKRNLDKATIQAAMQKLDALRCFMQTIPEDVYAHQEKAARERLKHRDEDDWPYLALALLLDCPIWTEDMDFFGCGVPVWTTDRIELYLKN